MSDVHDELSAFVQTALADGCSREEVGRVLLEAGWPKDQVKDALNAFAEVDFPIPVPKPRPYQSAREAFRYLVLFTALIVAAVNLGVLLFEIIEHFLPDPGVDTYRSWKSNSIRWAVSYILVATPVYLFCAHMVGRSIQEDPEKRRSKIRKWLTHLTLFIAAAFIMGDTATLVFKLLGGELTLRFLLKAATIFLISGTVFGYYLHSLREDERVRA